MLDGKGHGARFRRGDLGEDVFHVAEDLGAVLEHRLGPLQIAFEDGLEEEQGRARRRASQPWCRVPLVSPASMITVASLTRAMVRLRWGKECLRGVEPGGNWETRR